MRNIVRKTFDAIAGEVLAAAKVEVAEFARCYHWSVFQRIDLGIFTVEEQLEGLIVKIETVGQDEPLQIVAFEELQQYCLIVEPFDLARTEILEPRA